MHIPGITHGQAACDGVFIGGVVVACREGPLLDAGVTHVVNVTPNEKNFFPGSFAYMRVPVNDTASGRLNQHWEPAYRFMAGTRVLPDGLSSHLISSHPIPSHLISSHPPSYLIACDVI
jgi:hypothetical protein